LSVDGADRGDQLVASAGVARASTTATLSSPTMTPEFGSPSVVKAYAPGA